MREEAPKCKCMKEPEILKLWRKYQIALDKYDKDPYRSRINFWSKDEHNNFESFIHWLEQGNF